MKTERIFSIDGVLCDDDAARISVMDHGFLYGDGVFEGLRFYHGKVLKADAHLRRLQESATAIGLRLPMTTIAIKTAITEAIAAYKRSNGYVRLIATRGNGPLGIDPGQCEPGRIVIIVDELSMVSESVREEGAKLIIAGTRQLGPDQLDARIKSLNYMNQILARLEANAASADEAVMLNQSGFVAEGTADNIFIVKDGCLMTPPLTDGALDGITRRIILELAEKVPIETRIQSMTPFDLYTADECFLTGTGAELIPVREISGRQLKSSPGTVYKILQNRFQVFLNSDEAFD